ncbi:protein FANTASTIC FOUR [Trifolium repens]|nr:protein FANTASTIC FOUR [Trifolium repens]
MSSSLCQGLQSCLEPLAMEPRVLRLKLAPPGSNISPPSLEQEKPIIIINNNECDKNDTKSGWSFLQNLTKNENGNDKVYVHPTVKRSASMLSEKSLEMCTESLGSETGSNAGESSDDVSLFSCETRNDVNNNNNNMMMNNCTVSRRVNRVSNFPPPLTSITDFGGVHVRPYREGGRLILEAIASPSITPYFHAERCDGRLKLSLFQAVYDYDGDDEDYEEEDEVEEYEEGESEKEHEEVCDDVVCEEECVENVEDEMGVTKFGRPRRCKESGNRDFFGDGYFDQLPSISLCL